MVFNKYQFSEKKNVCTHSTALCLQRKMCLYQKENFYSAYSLIISLEKKYRKVKAKNPILLVTKHNSIYKVFKLCSFLFIYPYSSGVCSIYFNSCISNLQKSSIYTFHLNSPCLLAVTSLAVVLYD